MLALNYDKVELNKSLDVFREKLINYTIKGLNNSKDVLVLVQDIEDPKGSFWHQKLTKRFKRSLGQGLGQKIYTVRNSKALY